MDTIDLFLAGLQLYFITMNWTVERSYCAAPITEESDCFLCPETYEFCTAHNPLFLARPEWLRLATCFSAYTFCLGYLVILYASLTNSWAKLRAPILLFVAVHKSNFAALSMAASSPHDFVHPTHWLICTQVYWCQNVRLNLLPHDGVHVGDAAAGASCIFRS